MEDLNQKLNEILNDEESMSKVRSLAESLLGNKEETENNNNSGLSQSEMAIIMKLISKLKNSGNDKRTALLIALKPNLSKNKQEKIDTAIKLLKLIEILPYLKESGILKNIL